jgi:hypothetical protein
MSDCNFHISVYVTFFLRSHLNFGLQCLLPWCRTKFKLTDTTFMQGTRSLNGAT